MQKNKKNLLIAGVIVLVVLAITGLVLTQGQNSNLQGLLPSFKNILNPSVPPPPPPTDKQNAANAAAVAAQKVVNDAAAAKAAAADKQKAVNDAAAAAQEAAKKNNQQQMGSPSQSQNLVVQALPQLVNVPKQPKTDGPESVASFNVLNKNQDTAVINSMTFNIQGDNSPQNVTNYELWANGTKLTTDKPDVNFSNKTVTFDNIRFVDFDQFKQVLISQNNSINVVVKAVTAKVLDGKASGVSVLYWLEVKSIALDWVSNIPKAPKTPYTANFTPAVVGQVSTYSYLK